MHTGALLSGKSATYHSPNREGGKGSESPDGSHLQKREKGMWEGKMSSEAPFVGSPLTSGEGKAEPLKHSTGRTGDRGADALNHVQAPMREKEMSLVGSNLVPP